MLNILSKHKYKLLFLLFKFLFNLKMDFLASLILALSIKELKSLNKKNNKLKILVFFKTSGIDDLKTTFSKYRNHNFKFYYLQRRFFRVIFNYYFGSTKLRDYYYIIDNKKLQISLKNYNNRISKYIIFINKIYFFKAFISFNPFYMTDREIQNICSKLKIKFIALHKECVYSPLENKILNYLYKSKIEKFNGFSISAYSENESNLLTRSKFAKKNQVTVTGSPRCDISYNYRKLEPDQKTIVYYMIEPFRGAGWHLIETFSNKEKKELIKKLKVNKSIVKINWKDLANKTMKYCIKYAKNNQNVKLIIKGKQSSNSQIFIPKNLPKNVTYINSGSGHHLLKKSKVVIAFNTTAVLEGILANRDIIIPNFNINNIKSKNLVINFNNEKYKVKTENQFNKKLNYHINRRYRYRKLDMDEKRVLKKFIGNSDGNASNRLSNFLKNEI